MVVAWNRVVYLCFFEAVFLPYLSDVIKDFFKVLVGIGGLMSREGDGVLFSL